jgi:hypothetical protein
MAGRNLLIGFGETLTSQVQREPGGNSKKNYAYTIDVARRRLEPQLRRAISALAALPEDARPRGQGVALITIHPDFLSKYQLPAAVFAQAGLTALGSRAVTITPEKETKARSQPTARLAAQLYIAGTPSSFQQLLAMLLSPDTKKGVQEEFCRIESVKAQTSDDRLLEVGGEDDEVPIELVMHGNSDDAELLHAVQKYAAKFGAEISVQKHFAVPGLVFLPGRAPRKALRQVAEFSPLRALRRMPALRLNRPVPRQRLNKPAPALPKRGALNDAIRVAVFDGGMGVADFSPWATEHVPHALAVSHADYMTHGTEVTSALLFGRVPENCEELPQPYFSVDHFRILGAADEKDIDLYDCMNRIDAVLSEGRFPFANLSLGPRMNIDDDHPHAWTCMLDKHLASGTCLAAVAVGNDGELPNELGRVQPPADAVNALAVGAASSEEFMWDRAAYSCRGPGRSPGLVKPDGLSFGGCASTQLELYSPYAGGLSGVQGTSFAAPLALRVAAAAAAVSETGLSATALRALMIHRCERHTMHETTSVGWGRFPSTVEALLECADNEATVLYQGFLPAGKPLRAKLPLPTVPMGTQVNIKATFCFASPVDPADSLNYTRHGLTIIFRPRGEGSTHPFFSSGPYSEEGELRQDAHKWETVLHRSKGMRAEELLDACFDIQHGAREHGRKVNNRSVPPLPYVLVVTITTDSAQQVYTNVLQRYRTLAPIRLRSRIDV